MRIALLLLSYLAIGLVIGTMSALFGIGGGVLMVPAMVYIYGLEMQVAVGTSLAVMIPTAIAGMLRHSLSYGNVDFKLAALLAVGAMIGAALVGAPLAEALPAETLKKLFGVLLVISGLKMTGAFDYLVALAK